MARMQAFKLLSVCRLAAERRWLHWTFRRNTKAFRPSCLGTTAAGEARLSKSQRGHRNAAGIVTQRAVERDDDGVDLPRLGGFA